MSVMLSAEQLQFKKAVGRFFDEVSPASTVRAFVEAEAPFARDVWQRASTELGLMGVHLPEEFGGAGFGARELGIVCEEMGRTLYTGPYFGSSVMASCAVLFLAVRMRRHAIYLLLPQGSRSVCWRLTPLIKRRS